MCLSARLRPDSLGELTALPIPPNCIGRREAKRREVLEGRVRGREERELVLTSFRTWLPAKNQLASKPWTTTFRPMDISRTLLSVLTLKLYVAAESKTGQNLSP